MSDSFFRNAKRVDMFVIDGQNDFCASGNEPADWPSPGNGPRPGALQVVGADQEAFNVARLIDELADPADSRRHRIDQIHPSLDCHHENDGAHNNVWQDRAGNMANPFQIVTHADVVAQNFVPNFAYGVWEGKKVAPLEWALKYTKALEDFGRNPLCLWPAHCLIGTWGNQVYKPLMDAYSRWTRRTGGWIDWITKGQFQWTEHYSALKADVPDPTVPATQMNAPCVQNVMRADLVIWTGWAGSHCLKWTGLDAVDFFEPTDEDKAKGKKNEFITKCVFVEDASAPVGNVPGGPDFGQWRLDFLDEMVNRGARVMKTNDLIRELKA